MRITGPLALSIALLLSACGQDMVNITLLTPIPVRNPTQNLSQTLLQRSGQGNALVTTLSSPSCKQMDLRAGFKAPGWNTPWIPVALDTEILDFDTQALGNLQSEASGRPPGGPTSLTTRTMTAHLNQHSALQRPIVIPVPKGIEGEISVQGVVVEPIDAIGAATINENGTRCKRMDGQFKPIKSFAIYGKTPFRTSVTNQVSIDINVIQSMNPNYWGLIPTPYTLPLLQPLNATNSQFKCRKPNDPKSCSNLNLFKLRILTSVSDKFLIQHPPPPSNETLNLIMGVPYNVTGPTPYTYYFPKLTPILLSYFYGMDERLVTLRYFQKQISFTWNGTTVSQPLTDCISAGEGWVGNLPTDPSSFPNTAAGCSPGQYNFSIVDLGLGFE